LPATASNGCARRAIGSRLRSHPGCIAVTALTPDRPARRHPRLTGASADAFHRAFPVQVTSLALRSLQVESWRKGWANDHE
jgi:hypothetical protein